MVAVDLL